MHNLTGLHEADDGFAGDVGCGVRDEHPLDLRQLGGESHQHRDPERDGQGQLKGVTQDKQKLRKRERERLRVLCP